MAKDLSKYIFDADNPQDFKAYGLLKNIFKKQNTLLVIDLFFFNEIFKDIIWTEDVIEEIWDKPDNFEALSSNEKMDLYIIQNSESEYFDVIESKIKPIKKNKLIKSTSKYFHALNFTNLDFQPSEDTLYLDVDYTENFQVKNITKNFGQKISMEEFDRSFSHKEEAFYVEIVNYPSSNILFLLHSSIKLNYIKNFTPDKTSAIITLYENKEFLEEFKYPKHTHPIILKKPEHIHQLLNKVIQDAKVTRLRPKNDVPKAYLKNIKIKNYYTIKDITLNKIYNKKEIYILGENGDGKTLLLQAILMAAKWQQIENSDLEITGVIHQQAKENSDLELYAEDTNQQKYTFRTSENFLQNIFAYGVNRQENNADTDDYGFMTLFKKDMYLREPTSWLQRLYTKDLERQANDENVDDFLNLEKAKDLLNDLLEKKVTIEVTADEVRFTERGSENVKFEQLSDGYRSILIWVCDLVSRLAENQPKVTDTRDFHGVVLVDEIGLHLHPKWEANLVEKLRTWFPKIQFILTTHSPIIILNADEKAVVYRLYKEEGVTKISDQYQCSELSDLMLNGLITSPLFDVESAAMRFTKNSDLSDDFRLGRLRKLVDEEYQRLKKSGKVYISPTSIDDIIKKVMAEN